jgi:hypothetical protein
MGSYASQPELLALHAVRLKGMADSRAVARRFALDADTAADLLLDFQAFGWIRRVEFAGTAGWTLTTAGRAENERQLAAELRSSGTRSPIIVSHAAFLDLNTRFLAACTDWQIRPSHTDRMARNDHSDAVWDGRVLDELAHLRRRLEPVCAALAQAMIRFDGYDARFTNSLKRVELGQRDWVDTPGIDSCHTVWAELHEDLIATLGIERGAEP